MKNRILSSFLMAAAMLMLPVLAQAQSWLPVSDAKVVAVDKPGAVVVRGGTSLSVSMGMLITEGDRLMTNGATVGLVFKNGSTLNVSPDTQLEFQTVRQAPIPSSVRGSYGSLNANPSESITKLNLVSGDVSGNVKKLRAVAPNSRFEVATKVGVAGIRGTTFRVTFMRVGGIWSYKLSNIVGDVVFIPSAVINAENVITAIPAAGEDAPLAAGEEIIIEGTYDSDTNEFTLTTEGYQQATVDPAAAAEVAEAVEEVNEQAEQQAPGGEGPAETGGDTTGGDEGEGQQTIIVPEDTETASNPG